MTEQQLRNSPRLTQETCETERSGCAAVHWAAVKMVLQSVTVEVVTIVPEQFREYNPNFVFSKLTYVCVIYVCVCKFF